MQGVGVKRVVDEEGDGGRKVLCMCVCVCVMTWLPFTFCLSVWCCCECWRRTCEEPDSGQQNGTPAWVFTIPPPLLSLSLCLPGLQLKTHIFSGVCVWGGVFPDQRGTKHIKSPRMENVVVFDQVVQRCQILHGSLTSLNHLIFAECEPLCLILHVILKFLLFLSCNSATHELVMRITVFI